MAVDVLSYLSEGRLFQIAHLMGTIFSFLDTFWGVVKKGARKEELHK